MAKYILGKNDQGEWDWLDKPAASARAVHIIGDECEFVSQADGKGYSSKSAYRRALKSQGLVELGNDRIEPKPFKPTPVGDTLRRVAAQKGVQF